MAIDTLRKRESALIDPWGVLIPDGAIQTEDRQTLIGQYAGIITPASEEESAPSTGSTTTPGDAHFRLYNSSGNRVTLPEFWIGEVSFELLERGGYGSGSLQVLVAWEDLALAGTEYLDVYLWGELAYRGWLRVTEKDLQPEGEQQTFELYGLMERAGGYQVNRRYVYSTPTDISAIASEILDDYVRIAGRYPSLVVDIQTVGITMQQFEGNGRSVRECMDALCDYAPAVAYWGFDANAAGASRFYFRPRPTATSYKYGIGGKVEAFVYPQDTSEIVNRLYLTGGAVSQPNLLTNGSFEEPLPNGPTLGNLLTDYSYEDNSGSWTLTGSRKYTGMDATAVGAPRSGTYWLEIDQSGEKGEQTVAIDYAQVLIASVWARYEHATNSVGRTVTLEVEGLDAGSSVVTTTTIAAAQDPGGVTYIRYQGTVDFSASPTVTQARWRVRAHAGAAANDGIIVDDAGLWERDGIASSGWEYSVTGAAKRVTLDWASKTSPATDGDPYHGGYCVSVLPSGIAGSSDYLELRTTDNARVDVRPGQRYTFGCWIGGPDLVQTYGVSVGIVEYKADGTVQTTTESTTSTGIGLPWGLITQSVTVNANTRSVECFIRIRANVTHYIDAAFLVEGDVPQDWWAYGYWPAESYERVIDVEYTPPTGTAGLTLDSGVGNSITTYGEREAAVSNQQVTDYETMIAYAEGYFNANALPKIQAQLRVFDAQALLKPDGLVRILNLPSGTPDPLFPAVVRYTVGDSIDIDADLGNERPEMVALMGLIAKRGG